MRVKKSPGLEISRTQARFLGSPSDGPNSRGRKRMMRKTALVTTAFVLTLTGCNACNSMRQSVTGLFRGCGRANNVGAPCDASCEMGAAAQCDPCAQSSASSSAHYGGYEDAMVGTSYEGTISGGYAGTLDGVTIGSPAGSTISSIPSGSTIPSGSYIGSPTPAAAPRTEMIRPKPAN